MSLSGLGRLLLPYGRTSLVLRGPARGMRFVAQPGMGLSFALGTHSAAPRYFSRFVSPGQTVYDVGANKGQMSLIFSALVGATGRVVAFEPSPAEYSRLLENLRLNGISNVSTYQAAAYDSSAELSFAYSPDHPTQGKLAIVETSYVVPGATEFPVRSLTLDSMLELAGSPDVIKVDVEGAAAAVLRGARRVIEEVSPVFYLELHGPEEQAGIHDELTARGYVAETIDGKRVADTRLGWDSPLWCYRPDVARS